MDEATASVEFATDEAIQKAIRSEFKSSTLLTIAHRLSSVIDYDRLLVLSDGKVAEFETPIVRDFSSLPLEGMTADFCRTCSTRRDRCSRICARNRASTANCTVRPRRSRLGSRSVRVHPALAL